MEMIQRPLQLVLIRHAESQRNKAKGKNIYFTNEEDRMKVKGIPDYKISLTPEGMMQAQKTGQCLRERFGIPDYFYHSGYARTRETLEGILSAFSPEEKRRILVRMNLFIRERDPGYAYDMTTKEAENAFPWLREHWDTFGGFFARPPRRRELV